MATTFVEYTGDGNATKQFTFPSYQESDVKVRVDGVLKTASTHYNITGYTTTGGGNVVFTSGNIPSSPANIRIYRDTNVDTAKATFTAGSSVKAADLNNNTTQLLYRAQEEQIPNLIHSYDIDAAAIETSNIKDANVTTAKIADSNVTTAKLADSNVTTAKIADSNVTTAKLADSSVTTAKIADNAVTMAKLNSGALPTDITVASANLVDGTIATADIADNAVTMAKLNSGALPTDITVASANIVNGTIVEADISNSAVTANKIADGTVGTLELANGAVTTAKLAADAVDATKLADDAVDTNAVQDDAITYSKIQNVSATNRVLGRDSSGAGHIEEIAPVQLRTMINVEDGATADQTASEIKTLIASSPLDASHLAANSVNTSEIANDAVTIDKIADAAIVTNSEQSGHTVNDTTFFTTAAAEARYFNVSSGETIKDGDTFPDNDTTIATTAAINDRIIDIVNDVGGFDIVESEQHFPNTNPQGQAGSAAVLSIKAASTNLVPSGTTLTIVNGNLANNANITITGVTSTIPSGFGFIVESTGTLHTYTFHRLVPKATEVTTVASNITNINNAANNETNINAAVSNASNINAAVSNASNITAVAGNASNINAAVSNASNINAAVSNASNITTTASNITNVNNVGNNVTNVNSVSNSAGANQTFTVTVQNVSGNKYFIDGVQTPVLKLARGKTYTFDMSDSSNSGHPLAFRDSSDNSYTTGVTTSGTAGSSGATVVIVVAANAPSSLKYYCTSHGNAMGNTITVIDDNVGIVAGSIANVNTTAGSIANVNTTAGSISNVNTVASNISNVNSFFNVYRIGSSNPTSSLDTGDLFFNTSTNSLKVYTGSAWVDGVTATGNFALKTGNTFTGDNIYNDNVKALFGTGSDLEIFHTGSASYIQNTGTTGLNIHSNNYLRLRSTTQEPYVHCTKDGSVDLYYDNSKKFETTANGASVTGRLDLSDNLDMPDNAKIVLGTGDDLKIYSDGSTVFFGGDDIRFRNKALNENMLTLSGDGSVVLFHNSTNRLQTDGNGITVQGNINMATDSTLQLGVGNDFKLFHNGTTNFIRSANGNINIDNNSGVLNAKFIPAGATELYHNGSKKLETDSLGTIITGRVLFGDSSSANDHRIKFGDSGDLQIYHSGTNSVIDNNTGDLVLRNNVASDVGGNIIIQAKSGEESAKFTHDGSVELRHDNVKKFETTSSGVLITGSNDASDTGVKGDWRFMQTDGTLKAMFDASASALEFYDNTKATFGDSDDLQIYHDSSTGNSYIKEATANAPLRILSSDIQLRNAADSEMMGRFIQDGAVELYHNGTRKLETQSYGVKFDQGTKHLDNGIAYFGTSGDLQIFHDGSNSRIHQDGTGFLIVQADNFMVANEANNEVLGQFNNGGAVDLYYDGAKKFETTSLGAKISSSAAARLNITSADNSSAILRLGPSSDDDAVQIWYDDYANALYYRTSTNTPQIWYTNNTQRLVLQNDGHLRPYADSSYDLGTSSYRWRNLYADTLYGDGSNLTGINTDLVSDTSPQLGGDLLQNGNSIVAYNNEKHKFGNSGNMEIYHTGSVGVVKNTDSSNLYVQANNFAILNSPANSTRAWFGANQAAQLYYDNVEKFTTASHGVNITDDELRVGSSSSSGSNTLLRLGTHGTNADTHGVIYYNASSNYLSLLVSGESHGSGGILIKNGGGVDAASLLPHSNNTYDLGSTSRRWRNVYTNDLNLSNEGGSNDVDGTWGDWTMQEGESDLFLKNNRSGKKYKFNLTEVS